MHMNYYPLKRILKDNQIIFIDGITRTGKLLLGSLVSSLDKMEHLEFGENFEFLLPALKNKKVKIDFVNAYLSNYLNQTIYNKHIGRNVNFRPSDRTGIFNSRNPKIYTKRLKLPEGNSVIKKIKKNKSLLPFITHEISLNIDLLLKMKMNFKIVEILRSPVETAYSWYKKGLGYRYGKDQRMFTLLIKKKNIIFPWYGVLDKKSKKKYNELEKCANYVVILNKIANKNLLKFKNNSNLFITSYDKITSEPLNELKKISKFLRTKINNSTIKFIKKERLPINKIKIKNNIDKKILLFKKNCSSALFNQLMTLEKEYRNNHYKLLKR